MTLRSQCRAETNRKISFTVYVNISKRNPSNWTQQWGGGNEDRHTCVFILNAHIQGPCGTLYQLVSWLLQEESPAFKSSLLFLGSYECSSTWAIMSVLQSVKLVYFIWKIKHSLYQRSRQSISQWHTPESLKKDFSGQC